MRLPLGARTVRRRILSLFVCKDKESEKEEEEDDEEEDQKETNQQADRDEDGWTYLHLVVSTYVLLTKAGGEETSRMLIRAIYRLALAGVDVHARDARGRTALALAAAESADHAGNVDQSLLTHLLRVGQQRDYYWPSDTWCRGQYCFARCRLSSSVTLHGGAHAT